jgi:hypothetical protein
MTNKLRADALGLPIDEPPIAGAQLHMLTRGTASIRQDAQPLRSKRYLATMVLRAEGWTLSVNTPPSSHGPFPSPEAAFAWWVEHRDAMPPSTWTPYRREAWPPGIDEDWAEHDDP